MTMPDMGHKQHDPKFSFKTPSNKLQSGLSQPQFRFSATQKDLMQRPQSSSLKSPRINPKVCSQVQNHQSSMSSMESMESLGEDSPAKIQAPKIKTTNVTDFRSNMQSFVRKQRIAPIGASNIQSRDASLKKIDVLKKPQ